MNKPILTDAQVLALLTDDVLPESGTTERIIWRAVQQRYARDIAHKEVFRNLAAERLARREAQALADANEKRLADVIAERDALLAERSKP